jgi:excinuclease ABC subunit A
VGPPVFVARVPVCHTGRYLARILDADAVTAAAAPKRRARRKAS